jgi:hypothetical protein
MAFTPTFTGDKVWETSGIPAVLVMIEEELRPVASKG